ncbi:DUF6732 family protein [Falsihalocynthiibacter sp. SS001]|uniref:DUF6732 family protein n=1 Tax=Falsihalocynthiibacter sp. SS001 TaxID=3349698 RepID=UPI0036D40DAC
MKNQVSKISMFAALALVGTPVLAHPGHVIETAGHSHWGALVALGAAVAVGVWAAKGRKKTTSEEASSEDEEELAEAEPQEA